MLGHSLIKTNAPRAISRFVRTNSSVMIESHALQTIRTEVLFAFLTHPLLAFTGFDIVS